MHSDRGRRWVTMLERLMLVGAAAAMLNCASTAAAVPCGATVDCKQVSVVPVCANASNCFCNLNLNECAYQLKNKDGCDCIAGEIKECDLPSGKGISHCVPVTTSTTEWGACAPLSALEVDASSAVASIDPAVRRF